MFRKAHLLVLFLFATGLAAAATLAPGAALPELVLEDQHEQRFVLSRDTRCVLFAADRAGGDIVGQALEGVSTAQFEALGLRNVADISGMPTLIAKMFALPALRARPYPIGLVRDAAITADFPREAGAVTILHFAQGHLTTLSFAHSAAELQQALGVGK
jgi:hypothetical protein